MSIQKYLKKNSTPKIKQRDSLMCDHAKGSDPAHSEIWLNSLQMKNTQIIPKNLKSFQKNGV